MNPDYKPPSELSSDHELNESDDSRSLDRSVLPNRRTFFANFLKESVTVACTLNAFTASGAASIGRLFETSKSEDSSRYPFTDKWLELTPGVGFRNLGVRHTSAQFLTDRETLLAAIETHDVVLLEGCRGQEYFDFVAALAHHRGKKVVRLESDISALGGLAVLAGPLGSGFMSVSNAMHYSARIFGNRSRSGMAPWRDPGEAVGMDAACDEAPEKAGDSSSHQAAPRSPKPSWRRAFLSLAASGVNEVFGVVRSTKNMERNPDSFYHTDWSYTVDGRTVLMLGEIETFLQENRGISAVCITGDLHARGFCAYLSSPDGRETFRRKLAFYESVFKPFLGGTAQVERDPQRA